MQRFFILTIFALLIFLTSGCKVSKTWDAIDTSRVVPAGFPSANVESNSAALPYNKFFKDTTLVKLIDTALSRNYDLLGALQRIEASRAEIMRSKGSLFPVINGNVSGGQRRFGKYTMDGVGNYDTNFSPNIESDQRMPEHLPDYYLGLQTSWEADIWGKLRHRKKAALARFLSGLEGRKFLVSNLVSEVSLTYFDLLSIDEQLKIIRESILIQDQAFQIIKIQKEAGVANELAVKQFESQVLQSRSMEIDFHQDLIETESRLNFLLARAPRTIARDSASFYDSLSPMPGTGLPVDLLSNRADVKEAEFLVHATKADLSAAKAAFYPSLTINADVGLQAFNAAFLFSAPASLAYGVFGGLTAPLINRSALKSEFRQANARQQEAIYNYYKTFLAAYVEVYNQLNLIRNLAEIQKLKSQQVNVLTESVEISSSLFRTGRASYFEVLMTQQNMLNAKLALVTTRQQQMQARIGLYKSLGGGWR